MYIRRRMNCQTTPLEAVESVVACFETQAACAEALGTTQPTISRWLNVTRRIGHAFVLRAESITGVARHDLRPDLYPRETMRDQHTAVRFAGVDQRAMARQNLGGISV